MSPVAITLILFVFMAVMFVWEKIPLGVTSMIVLLALVLTKVPSVSEAFFGFVNSNVIIVCSYVCRGRCGYWAGASFVSPSAATAALSWAARSFKASPSDCFWLMGRIRPGVRAVEKRIWLPVRAVWRAAKLGA